MVVQLKSLVIMAQKIADHVDNENTRAHKVYNRRNDCVPKSLRVCFVRRDWRVEQVHVNNYGDELDRLVQP
jgi:hypothetical protein